MGATLRIVPYPREIDPLLAALVDMEKRRRRGHGSAAPLQQEVIEHTPLPQPVVMAPTSVAIPSRRSVVSQVVASAVRVPIVAAVASSPIASAAAVASPVAVSMPSVGVRRSLPQPTVTAPSSVAVGMHALLTVAASSRVLPTPTLYSYSAPILREPVIFRPASHNPGTMSHSLNAAASLAQRLFDDNSEFALRPSSFATLERMCAGLLDTTWDNPGSARKLDSNMKLWRLYTGELNTPMWRPHATGLSSAEIEREAVLASGFITFALRHMRGRKGNAHALPQSAYKALRGVYKAHEKRFLLMVPTKMVWTMVQRHCRQHLERYGGMSMVVSRKQPFTNAIFDAIFDADGRHGPIDLAAGNSRLAFRAFASLLKQTGMRKSELSLQSGEAFSARHASRANVRWCLRGRIYSSPPLDLLRSPRPGDYMILVPPVSKADPTGAVWGALPIYLHYDHTDSTCAFTCCAALEVALPASGDARRLAPLISPDGVQPFRGSQLDSALASILRGLGVPARSYSWHSARIRLACCLLEAGASSAQVQALCRWQTEDSLRVYARLNPDKYKSLLDAAARADPSSVSTANLPPLSDELAIRQLLGLSLADATRAEPGE